MYIPFAKALFNVTVSTCVFELERFTTLFITGFPESGDRDLAQIVETNVEIELKDV